MAGIVSFQEEGIMRYQVNQIDELTLQNIVEYNEAVRQLGGGKAYCNLVVMKEFVQIGDDARKYAAAEESNMYTIADAFVIDSFALKIVGNFYMRYNKPVRPTRMFNTELDALKWLRTFL